jgi:hypothetical protein
VDFLDTFSQKFPVANFTKIHPVGDVLTHADRQTCGHDEGNRCCFASMQKGLKMHDKTILFKQNEGKFSKSTNISR